ncbi:hypothetical protein BG004_007680 [Podila humilis]|nr:hypothetical protein BG004_007680 [Podila humilis]
MAQKRLSTSSTSGQNMTQVSPTTSTSLDLLGRAKSREFLRVCLQEISYLTSSVPQSITASIPPAPSRLARQESEKRTASHGNPSTGSRQPGLNRNRNSDYYPNHAPSSVAVPAPPPMPRSSSVPVPTLQTLSSSANVKPIATSGNPPLSDMTMTEVARPSKATHDKVEDATLRQVPTLPQLPQQKHLHERERRREQQQEPKQAKQPPAAMIVPTSKHQRDGSVDLDIQKAMMIASKSANGETTVSEENSSKEFKNEKTKDADNSGHLDEDDEPITVIHSPISEEHWYAQLQKAGQKITTKNSKKVTNAKVEDEAQLSKDVQDKFNISSEKLNRMVKEWDRSKQQDNGVGYQKSIRKKKGRDSAILDELAGLSLNLSEFEAEEAGATKAESGMEDSNIPRWRHKASLKRHLDAVSSLAFHPTNKALLTGSDDGTMRYWNLESALRETRRNVGAEVEPLHVYRGHKRSITSVAISEEQNKCFSSSMDSTIRSWKLVPMDKETYSRGDRSITLSSYVGHTDVVWEIRLFPLSISSSSQLLASISADGTLKIWDTEAKSSTPLKSSWGYHGSSSTTTTAITGMMTPVPTSVNFCPSDLKKVVVSYTNSVVKLFDIETGQAILDFKSDETYDGTTSTQINSIACHPTMPVVVSGHEDRYIRFFDLNSGTCSFSMLSHLDAVSSLDIDPAGLVLCSGGQDGSVRLWDLASTNRACLQEFPGHRRRGDEGVCAVQYHPTCSKLLATGGADSVAKLWAWS